MRRVFGGAIFDCDGLLVETESRWKIAERRFVERHGGIYTEALGTQLTGSSAAVTSRVLGGAVGWGESRYAELVAELRADFHAVCDDLGVEAMPGAVALVTTLAERMPIAIASNSAEESVRRNLALAGIPLLFRTVISAYNHPPKPAPDVYLAACDAIGVAALSAVAFEDSRPGAAAARAAGMYVVGVPFNADDVLDADTVVASLADVDIDQLA